MLILDNIKAEFEYQGIKQDVSSYLPSLQSSLPIYKPELTII